MNLDLSELERLSPRQLVRMCTDIEKDINKARGNPQKVADLEKVLGIVRRELLGRR